MKKFFVRLAFFLCLLSPLCFASHALAEVLEGRMVVSIIDYRDGTHEVDYAVESDSGELFQIEFSKRERLSTHVLKTGARVRLQGQVAADSLFVADSADLVQAAPRIASRNAIANDAVTGTRRPIIVLVSVGSDNPFCSADEIDATMFTSETSARAVYETSSRNQLTWARDTNGDGNADIVGPFTVSASSGSCSNYSGWAQAAFNAAENAGVDFSPYNHRVFVLPRICGFGGVANLACGEQCTSYILDCHQPNVWAHELGHNLGYDHAGDDFDNDGFPESEYGDTSCPMGFTYSEILFNAVNTYRMGWFDAFSGKVQTITSTSHVNIAPLETDSTATSYPQLLRIQKSSGDYYYLSYRARTGTFDEVGGEFNNQLNLHRALDSSLKTGFVDGLATGESFTDSTLGVTVCHNSFNGSALNASIVFGSHTCEGSGDPGGETGGAVPGDSDGDGVTDAQEAADGTNSSDPGSYMERVSSPTYALWNSFLGMTNILELVNPASGTTNVNISLYGIDGSHVYTMPIALTAGQQYDIILNDFPGFLASSYGIIKVTYSGGELDGRLSYYRTSGSSYEFAYSVALAGALRGTTGVGFNTYQPSANAVEANYQVNNWLTIVNLASSTKQFQIRTYNQTGTLLTDLTHTIAGFGRTDVDGGHQLVGAGVVGFHEIIPLDADEPYLALNTRYGTNANPGDPETAFFFAFPLIAHAGNGEPMYLPISRQFGESNWVEILNTRNAATDVTVEWYTQGGEQTTETISLGAYSQLHLPVGDSRLSVGERSFVRIIPSAANSVIAQSMLYYRDSAGGIDAMSGIQAREDVGASYEGSFNLFLNMQNWLHVSNILNQTVTVTIDSAGSDSSTGSAAVTLSPYQSVSIPVHATSSLNVSANTYGSLDISPDEIRSLIVDLHRVRYEGEEIDFAFPTAVRGR